MKQLGKYLVLKKNGNTNFCIIAYKMKTSIVINRVSGQNPIIETTNFEDNITAETTAEKNILDKIAQGYKEETQPDDLSLFSIAMENLKTTDIGKFESGILTLKELTTVYYSRDKHPFVKFLGIKMKDESFVTTPILDEYLKNHINEISTAVLVAVVQMTLQNIYFNFEATRFAVEESIKRKDLKAQLAIVKQFFEACKYYDAGHRFWSNTIQDKLIDTYFPEFEAEALLNLLEKVPTDMLSGEDGDAMETLFIPALNNTDNQEIQQNILSILETYKKEYEEEGYVEDDYFEELFEEISADASDYVIKGLEQIEGRIKSE